jgi:thiamine-monophosphate kinase
MGTPLSEVGEFGFIERISHDLISRPEWVIQGIGDDASVFRPRPGLVMLLTTDMLVEGVHFLVQATTFRLLGRKSLAVNLSDMAAMGAEPMDAYVCVAVPGRLNVEDMEEFYRGLREMAREHGVNILGGDTTRSNGPLVINVALTGCAPKEQVLLRSGAAPGDLLYVTGTLGDAGAGLDLLKRGGDWPGQWGDPLLRAHLDPRPHLLEGLFLAQHGFATSMMDLSDGLASDLRHICKRSQVGAIVREDAIPISGQLRRYAEWFGLEPLALALGSGEDYCLLLTVPPQRAKEMEEAFLERFGRPIRPIGEITQEPEILLGTGDGNLMPLPMGGWDSFASESP